MRPSRLMTLFLWGLFTVNELLAETVVPERTMNVRQGPETVFDTDVAEILPQLKGATATQENGRIGNELVFWGYRQASGDPVYLYACAPLEGVDCLRRSKVICPVDTQVISQSDRSGQISRIQCAAVCDVRSVEVLPCCRESVEQNPLMVGVVKCQ